MIFRKTAIAAVVGAVAVTGCGAGTAFAAHHHRSTSGTTSSVIVNSGHGGAGGQGGKAGAGGKAFNRF
jgi:hypothetical protein